MYLCGMKCQIVQLIYAYTKDNRHLVDESTGASGTIPVHTQIFGYPIFEKHHFGILSADVYHGLHTRISVLYGFGSCHDLLDEMQ